MISEDQIFVSYKDADKADELYEGNEMVVFLANYMEAQKQYELANGIERDEPLSDSDADAMTAGEFMKSSGYKQASAVFG